MQYLIKNKSSLATVQLILFCSMFFISEAQTVNDSMLIEKNYRTFHFTLPQSVHPGASLIFILHGSGGNGIKMMEHTSKLSQEIKNENVIAVYPDGYKNFWNECRKAAPSDANVENIYENAFFNSMIDYFDKNYQINKHNVFAVGTSGGGHMAYKLALTEPGRFKAVTAVIA